MFLQVHNADLRWLDPETSTPTTTQPINKIRVWGIGLENERDFGYVARDADTKKHKCHVFRCERPARAVARALLEAHQKEKHERNVRRSKRQEVVSPRDSESSGGSSVGQKERRGLGKKHVQYYPSCLSTYRLAIVPINKHMCLKTRVSIFNH